MSDSDKLSRKSFDNLPSGFKLTATSDLLTTLPVVRPVDYELSYLRRERIVPKGLIKLFVLAYDRLVKGSAVRQSGLAQQQNASLVERAAASRCCRRKRSPSPTQPI